MSQFEIRTASVNDAEALSGIYRYYVENTAVSYEYIAPDKEEFERRIANTLAKYPYIVAERNGRIAGYAYAGPFNTRAAADWSAEVSIYVARDQRRGGLGRALYARLEELLKEMHYQSLVAKVAFCNRDNDEYLSRDSVDFHHRCGYRTVGAVENCGYKFGHWYGLMFMQKDIGDFPHKPERPLIFEETGY